ncbi:MAG: MotA/TolQ/ExbB proton channel family protein [Bdellovibrionaceae bacterium]|nr:MotA/TolQ/ExbB proton channel family protein [Pseudobdellovibrionaceae bacterium]
MLEQISIFLSAGGPVLWLIFFVLLICWFLIFEIFYYFYKMYPLQKQKIQKIWLKREDKNSWFALKIREEVVSNMTQQMSRWISIIKTLVIISPLLGLLGTVTGMISIFDIISISGTGNPRLMASGISLAVIPTMAGLVTALSGLYFGSYFDKKLQREKNSFLESLNF